MKKKRFLVSSTRANKTVQKAENKNTQKRSTQFRMSAKQKKKEAEKAKSKKSRESALTEYCGEGYNAVSSRARKREKRGGKEGQEDLIYKKKEEGMKNEPERSSCGKDQYGKTNTITYVQLFISTSADKHKKKIRRK